MAEERRELVPAHRRRPTQRDAHHLHGNRAGSIAAFDGRAESLGQRFHFGRLLHTNIVLDPETKRRLGIEHRAVACDMETAAVRRWAQPKLPVIGVRAVLDELKDEVPDAPQGEYSATPAEPSMP